MRAHSYPWRIELAEAEQIEHGFAVQEHAFPSQDDGNRRLGERGRRYVAVGVDNLPCPRSASQAASFRTSTGHTRVLGLGLGLGDPTTVAGERYRRSVSRTAADFTASLD